MEDVLIDALAGEWGDVFGAPFAGVVPEALVAMVLIGAFGIALLTWTGSFEITGIWFVLGGGIYASTLPGQVGRAIAIVVTLLLAAGFYAVYNWRDKRGVQR